MYVKNYWKGIINCMYLISSLILNKVKIKDFEINYTRNNIFQTPEMYEVYKNTKNYEPVYLSVVDEKKNLLGSLLAVIQKEHSGLLGKLSSRAIIWGGPLVKNNDLEILDFILSEFNKIVKRKAIYTQFRNMWEYTEEEKGIFKKNGFLFEEHLDIIHDLALADDQFFEKMHKGRRKNVRRAIRKGLDFEEISTLKELLESLKLIRNTYSRVKMPMPDESFFISVFNDFHDKEMVKFFGCKINGKLIGTRYVFIYNKLVYDWYAGTDDNYLDYYPNDFLPFKIMQWGRNNGYKTFQFGGAGKPNKPYGVRDYKLKSGGELVNWGRFEKINQPVLMKVAKIGFELWKKFK